MRTTSLCFLHSVVAWSLLDPSISSVEESIRLLRAHRVGGHFLINVISTARCVVWEVVEEGQTERGAAVSPCEVHAGILQMSNGSKSFLPLTDWQGPRTHTHLPPPKKKNPKKKSLYHS